ncbi:MAG: COG1470 family protein, partial [Candidatus Heimdallarchaeaceae archaeon]
MSALFYAEVFAQTNPQATISADPTSCIEQCSPTISWTSNSENIVKIYRNGVFHSNQSPNGTLIDWNLSEGTYTYTIRIVDSSWTETGDLDSVTVNVLNYCADKPDGTSCTILGSSGECYNGSCLLQGLCYVDENCDYLNEGLCYGECRINRETGEQHCYQIGPDYNLVCQDGACVQVTPAPSRGYHIGGDCYNECAVDTDCRNINLTMSPMLRTINQGDATSFGINIFSVGGFSGDVDITISGCPQNVVCTLPSRVNVPEDSYTSLTMTVTNTDSAPIGSFPITVTATETGGSISDSDTSWLEINGVFDINVSMLPDSRTIYQGDNTNFGVTISSVNNFSGNVNLT